MSWGAWIYLSVMWFGAVVVIGDRLTDIANELRRIRQGGDRDAVLAIRNRETKDDVRACRQ